MTPAKATESRTAAPPEAAVGASAWSLEDPRVIQAVQEYVTALEAGRKPDRREFAARYPEFAAALAGCLDAVEFVHAAASRLEKAARSQPTVEPSAPAEVRPEAPLGDYRIVCEIGRGGMGVVYEAVQISLGRRVALKVLPFAAALDSRQLQRFKNEAHAAAQLHHTNIVPVFGVGCERGVHYYAMQFIEGQTLAAVIQDLRQQAGTDDRGSRIEDRGLRIEARGSKQAEGNVTIDQVAPGADTPRQQARSSILDPQSSILNPRSPIFRTAARLGVQAAEALEHAHALGVIHRDIKPGNLLVDGRGNLWVTDFGLAHCQSQPGLTMTGDLVGTLRYMSPEQALAKRVIVDHRTDIYSLGVTLYELLTLQPAYPGRDRQELLRQIAFEDPQAPRRVNPAIPQELETIVLKAIAKNPEERYATAKDLADDLERFLEDKPIRARRPTLVQRLRKWCRRHLGVVVTAGSAAAVLLVLVAAVATIAFLREQKLKVEAEGIARAEKATREERDVTLYFQRIALAERELAANNGSRAEQLLDKCPPELRGWEWHFLKRRLHEEPLALEGHTKGVLGVAFSPNGQVLASASWDGTVRLWDPRSGACLRILTGESATYESVAFSPDGQRLAASRSDGAVTVWDLAADRRWLLQGHTDRVEDVAFSPGGQHLASAGRDGNVIIWDLSAEDKRVFSGHDGVVHGVAYSPDGLRLAAVGEDPRVYVRDMRTGELLPDLMRHPHGAQAVAYSPDGRYLATGGLDQTVRLWDVATGSEIWVLRGHTTDVSALAFSPDGRRLVSTGYDMTVRVWDPVTGQQALTLRDPTRGVNGLAFSPDGWRLAAAGAAKGDIPVRIWNATPLAEDGSPDPLRVLTGHRDEVNCVAFSPNGELLASGGDDKTVRVWGASTGQVIHTLRSQDMLNDLAFSPDGIHVAASGQGGIVNVWDTRTGRTVLNRRLTLIQLQGVSYSPDGRLALSDSEGFVRILDAATGKELAAMNGQMGGLWAVAFSPDGQYLASAGNDKAVRIWDTKTKQVQVLPGHQASVNSMAYHPDGKSLATGSDDGLVILWDVTAAKEMHRFRAHRDAVLRVRFSQDGRCLATASQDGTVKFWDATTGRLLCLLRPRQQALYAMAFHPDGRQLASAGADGTVKIWAVPPAAAPATAK